MAPVNEVAGNEPSGVLDDEGLPTDRPRTVGRRIVSGVVSYGVVVLAIWFLLTSLQSGDWTSAVALITGTMVAASVVLGLVNLATNWPPIVVALPGLRVREAAVTNTAGAALSNTVPEGGAVATGLNYAMLRSWGFTLGDTTSEVLVTGTWSQLTKFILLALGLTAVVLQDWAPDGVEWIALGLVALVAVAVVVLGAHPAQCGVRRPARCVVRPRGGAGPASDPRPSRPRPHRGASALPHPDGRVAAAVLGRLTATMVLSQLTVVLVLGICVRMQGLDQATISWAVILVAWGLVTFASLLIPTPAAWGRRGGARRCARPRAARLRPGGGAGGRPALPHRDLPRADPDRAGHLPVLAPVDRVAPAGELPWAERR